MKKKIRFSKRIISCISTMAVTVSLSACMMGKVQAAENVTLKNPRIVEDSTMHAGQKVTYDCIWFGNYPQTEVKEGESCYSELANATGWNSNNEIIINGTKYRRMLKGDATYATSGYSNYYNWEDSTTYHYFRYEPIKWRVLETDGNTAMLLSDVALDDQKYNAEGKDTTWETCTLRSWLNGYGTDGNYSGRNFIDSAFSVSEQLYIADTNVVNSDNILFGQDGGNNTTDKIFLLSESEVYTNEATVHGFVSSRDKIDEARICKSSGYAKAMGVGTSAFGLQGNCTWWLRSSGGLGHYIVIVNGIGCVNSNGKYVLDNDYGVRVALNLNLSSPDLYTYAGTVCSDEPIPHDISSAKVILAQSLNVYNGKKQNPEVTSVVLGKCKLIKGIDYEVSDIETKNAGIYTVYIKGIGEYRGQASAVYTISAKSLKSKSVKTTISPAEIFKGGRQNAAVKIKDGSQTLKKDKDYSLTFKNNTKIGRATVTITGKGNYSGTLTGTFNILPAKPSIRKAVNEKGNKIKVSISKVKGASYYTVFYKIKGTSKWNAVKTEKNAVVIGRLKKNKTYEIKVSAGAKSGGKTYTGQYSSTVSVKVKK